MQYKYVIHGSVCLCALLYGTYGGKVSPWMSPITFRAIAKAHALVKKIIILQEKKLN